MDAVNVEQARQNLAALLSRVVGTGERIVITENGQDRAALVGMADLQRLQRLDEQAEAARREGSRLATQAAELRRQFAASGRG